MKPNLLFLTIVAVFLILIPQEAHATNDGDLTYGDEINLAFNTSRQPNLNNPTLVSGTVFMDVPVLSSEAGGFVLVQNSSDNVSWTTAPTTPGFDADVAGLGIALGHDSNFTFNVFIPKGHYYRILAIPTTGTPAFTLLHLKEIEFDVFEFDPLSEISCSQLAKPSDQVYCGFTSYYQNQTYRNDIVWTVNVSNQTLEVISSQTAFNTNNLGKYRFNWTSQSTPQTYEVTVFNTSLRYAKSFWIEADYIGLTPEQNATLYSAQNLSNLTYINTVAIKNETNYIYHNQTDGSLNVSVNLTPVLVAINDSEQRIKLNVTAEHTITRALINAINSTLYGRIALVVIDVFSYIMTNGDTYQEFIEGLDQNVTQFHDEEMTAIDNINVSFGNLSINQTTTTVAIAPRQKCLGLC